MKKHFRSALVVMALLPLAAPVLADPLPGRINPGSVKPIPTGTTGVLPGTAVAPEPTGPCRAELGVSQIEISRRAGGSAYDISISVKNIGTEAVNISGNVLGVSLEVQGTFTPRQYYVQAGTINSIAPGATRTFALSVGAEHFSSQTRSLVARIERGPDGPRCSYDFNRANDFISASYPEMRAAFDSGTLFYTRTAPWAR